ncbi:MAG TPA: hypothetical protein P5125_01245 [Kiritimatiellia bacterium]|nr:hypothetical protein [Kiritimatiellia bacterium]HOR97818.1 hypothetical protein [Kiritimatiellia bacterium]HRU18958.1 hypothetical protein [Kiritimatiellia bacterium]
MKIVRIVFLLVAGIGGARAETIPAPPKGEAVFPAWQAVRDTKTLRALCVPMSGTPQASWEEAGFARPPVRVWRRERRPQDRKRA